MKESRLTGVAVTAIGVTTLFLLIPVGIKSPSDVPSLALAPAFWPTVIASIFTLMGIIMTITPGRTDEETLAEIRMIPARSLSLAAFLAALFVYYFLVPVAGMVAPAMVLIFGLCWIRGERRWPLLILLAVLTPTVLTVFFLFIANIPIPLGIFEFMYG